MKKTIHVIYIMIMVAIVVAVTIYIGNSGFSYYKLPLEERYYHPDYEWFKPSGLFGHGIGIIGTLMIIVGVVVYILSKKYGFLTKLIRLKYLLEFHIFLCTLGPILVLYHTTFKFGGIVSIAFWSMVAVVLSGVVGRFIYIRIPRNIAGKDLSFAEIKVIQNNMIEELKSMELNSSELVELIEKYEPATGSGFSKWNQNKSYLRQVKTLIYKQSIDKSQKQKIRQIVKDQMSLMGKVAGLQQMQKLFKYWHVAHKPFALIMLVVVTIHVIVTLLFGYRWIF